MSDSEEVTQFPSEIGGEVSNPQQSFSNCFIFIVALLLEAKSIVLEADSVLTKSSPTRGFIRLTART